MCGSTDHKTTTWLHRSRPAVITNARALARYFLDICARPSAPLSVAAVKAVLAVLVPFPTLRTQTSLIARCD